MPFLVLKVTIPPLTPSVAQIQVFSSSQGWEDSTGLKGAIAIEMHTRKRKNQSDGLGLDPPRKKTGGKRGKTGSSSQALACEEAAASSLQPVQHEVLLAPQGEPLKDTCAAQDSALKETPLLTALSVPPPSDFSVSFSVPVGSVSDLSTPLPVLSQSVTGGHVAQSLGLGAPVACPAPAASAGRGGFDDVRVADSAVHIGECGVMSVVVGTKRALTFVMTSFFTSVLNPANKPHGQNNFLIRVPEGLCSVPLCLLWRRAAREEGAEEQGQLDTASAMNDDGESEQENSLFSLLRVTPTLPKVHAQIHRWVNGEAMSGRRRLRLGQSVDCMVTCIPQDEVCLDLQYPGGLKADEAIVLEFTCSSPIAADVSRVQPAAKLKVVSARICCSQVVAMSCATTGVGRNLN